MQCASMGDAARGNYELQFTATASFSFPGGQLTIGISSQGTPVSDLSCSQVLVVTTCSDSSNLFVNRFYGVAERPITITNIDTTEIGGFRLSSTYDNQTILFFPFCGYVRDVDTCLPVRSVSCVVIFSYHFLTTESYFLILTPHQH